MSEEQREGQGQVTRSSVHRGRAKDFVIIVLALSLLAMTGFAFRDRIVRAWGRSAVAGPPESGVKVFDVVVDRKDRSWVDFLFDRAIAGKRVGEVLPTPPATIEPTLGGVWRWQGPATLRFEPAGGFPAASEYHFDLIPQRFLLAGEKLGGTLDFVVKIDRFFVRQVTANEEAAPGEHQVLFRGSIDFNYAVDPEALAPLIHLIDPRLGEDHPLAVNLETGWQSTTIAFRTATVEKTPEPRKLALVIDGSLTPASGNAPLGAAYRREIPLGSSQVLEVRRIDPHPALGGSSMTIELSSPVAAGVAAKYISVAPSVPYRIASDGNRLSLNGDFEAGESYQVAIAEGLPATDQAVLRAPFQQAVHFANLPASVDFADQGMFLSALGAHRLALTTVNVSQVSLVVERVYPSNLFDLFEYGSLFGSDTSYSGAGLRRSLGDRLAEKTLVVAGPRNRRNTTVLDLDRYLPRGSERNGLFRVAVGQPGDWQNQQRWLLLTDLGAVAKVAPREAEVWVSDIHSLDPVAGARVTVYSNQNQRLGAAVTDAVGIARMPLPELPDGVAPYWATIRTSSDFTFVLFDRMQVDTADLAVGGAEPLNAKADAYQADLYGERDLYRPGEVVHGMAVVRTAGLGVPPKMPVILRHRDPQGHVLSSQRLMLDRHGAAEFSLDLPGYSLTGRHSLELVVAQKVIGQYQFSVEEFVPDRIEVAVKPPSGPVSANQSVSYRVESRYLFGPPAARLAVETRVRLAAAPFSPPGFSEYRFGNPDRAFEARDILTRGGRLDDNGEASFALTLPAALRPPAALEATLFARVQESGGRGVAALARVPVYPYPYFIGLKRANSELPSAGKPQRFDWLALTPAGAPTAAGTLRLEFFEDRFNTVLRRTPSGGFRYESKREPRLIASRDIEAGKKSGSFTVTPPGYGEFRVVLTDPESGSSSELSFSAGGWGYAPWAMANPSRVELELDKKEYRPGETATVEVKAPFPGRMLVTLERDRILWSKVVTLSGNSARLTIPVPGALRPNGYVTATLVRKLGDLSEGSVGRAFGAVPIDVDRNAHHLAPRISAPATVRSESKVEVRVDTRPGALVTVAAVDEGILQLIAQKTPDPFDFFYRKLALDVTTSDTYSLLLPEIVERAKKGGGGEGASAALRALSSEGLTRVKPVAFWSGSLTANSKGIVVTSFKLPAEFHGALRLMAVAISGADFGSAERRLTVRDPLIIMPTAPRVLSFGERLSLPVTLRNDTGKSGEFVVGLGTSGPVKSAGESSRTLSIPAGEQRTTYLEAATGEQPGEANLVFRASGNDEQARATIEIPVRSDLPPLATQQAGPVDDVVTRLPLATARSFEPGTVRRTLTIGPLPATQFLGRLKELLAYPYGCLEQTVSSAFPLLYFGDLAQKIAPELLDPAKGNGDPVLFVQQALAKVARLEVGNGRFALWPGEATPDAWDSLYATHFLVEAKRAGFEVDPGLLERSLDAVASGVRAADHYSAGELERVAYGLYILARAGRADRATMDFVRQNHANELDSTSRPLLAGAYAAAGDSRAGAELLAELRAIPEVARERGGNLDSPLRARAIALLALLEVSPDDPQVTVLFDRLSRDAGSLSLWTTQETAWVFLALGELAHRQSAKGGYQGEVKLGGRVLGAIDAHKAVSFADLAGAEPLAIEMKPGYSKGAAFYSLVTSGTPTVKSYAPVAAGLEVERQILTRNGDPADLAAIHQGDLLVIKARVRSTVGPVANVALEILLPSGLEVENPRLATSETLPWVADADQGRHLDLRDDRADVFTDLPANSWRTFYVEARAVIPGSFRLPPISARAMYDPAIEAASEQGRMEIAIRK